MTIDNSTGADTGGDEPGAGIEENLTDLAYSLEISPAPYQDVLLGGRRRRKQRRLLTVSAAVVATAAVLGTTLALHPGTAPVATTAAASGGQPAAAPRSGGSTPATSSAAPVRDPLKPVTVLLAQGSSGGRTWKAWADLWPAVELQDAFRQLQAMDAIRVKAIPQLPPATQQDAEQGWRAGTDSVNLYLTQDGKRLVDDTVENTPAPGTGGSTGTRAIEGDALGGTLLGFKGAEMGSTPVLLAEVGSDAAKVVVTWQDGSTSTPAVVTVGDSAVRWFAVAKKPGQDDRSIKVYDAHGQVLLTDTQWFH
jgi:hypothetical protein